MSSRPSTADPKDAVPIAGNTLASTARTPYQQLHHRRIQVGRVMVVCKMVLFLLFLSRREIPGDILMIMAAPFLIVWVVCAVAWLSLESREHSMKGQDD